MIKIILSLLYLVLLVVLIILGLVNYNSRYSDTPDKDGFSFLNQFPYEMQDNPTMKYSLLFKIISAFFGASYAVIGMYLFYFIDPYALKTIVEIILGILFIILGITMFCEFNITLKNYQLHLVITSSLFAFTICLYAMFGYFILSDTRQQYPNFIAYILFVICAGLLASLFLTPLKKWMYLEKEEKDGSVKYYRKHLSILPFMEWIFLLSDAILVILITIA